MCMYYPVIKYAKLIYLSRYIIFLGISKPKIYFRIENFLYFPKNISIIGK
jgi:predicted DNA-binding transcriptional regulator AlpA